MNPKCHICNAPSNFFMNKDGFDEYLCLKCGLSFVYPQPETDWLKNEVYSYKSGYQANKTFDLSAIKEDRRIRKIFKYLVRVKPGGKILDVGCSNGQFLYFAKKNGFGGVGVELNKRTAEMARENGFEVYNGFLETSPFVKKSFDIAYIGDVIEHVSEPQKFIETAKQFLKNDGIVVISTPNTDCLWSQLTLGFYRWFRIPWAVVTPPHHLLQFGLGNLNLLLKNNGFSLDHSFFFKPPSLKYELGSLHLWKRYKKFPSVSNLFFMIFAFLLYTFAYVLNILVKPFLSKDFHMICFYRQSADFQA